MDKKFQVDSLLILCTEEKKSQKFLILSNFHKMVTKKMPLQKNVLKRM